LLRVLYALLSLMPCQDDIASKHLKYLLQKQRILLINKEPYDDVSRDYAESNIAESDRYSVANVARNNITIWNLFFPHAEASNYREQTSHWWSIYYVHIVHIYVASNARKKRIFRRCGRFRSIICPAMSIIRYLRSRVFVPIVIGR